jgi:MFS family permease
MLIVVSQRCTFGAVTVRTLLLARQVWHPVTQPDAALSDFGLAAGSTAVGIFIAAALSALMLNRSSAISDETGVKHSKSFARMLPISAVLALCVTVTAVALGHRLIMFSAALSLGCAGQFMKINADTTIQRHIDDAHRGRAFAIFDMAINLATVAGVALFALVSHIRLDAHVAAVTIGILLSVVLVATLWLVQQQNARHQD